MDSLHADALSEDDHFEREREEARKWREARQWTARKIDAAHDEALALNKRRVRRSQP